MIDSVWLLSLLLATAVAFGQAARFAHVPRVVGYLVGGVALRTALGPVSGGDTSSSLDLAASGLSSVKTLALGLILFSIGGVLEKNHLRIIGRRIARMSTAEVATVAILTGVGCTVAWFAADTLTAGRAVAGGMLLGTMAIATAPAATVLVLREYGAKGPVSDALQTLTALNNAACIALFHGVFLACVWVGWIHTGAAESAAVWLGLPSATLGSTILGVGLGFVVSVAYAKLPTAQLLLLLLGVLLALGHGAQELLQTVHFSYSFLLTCLVFGGTFANIAVDQDRIHSAVQGLGGPIFAVFFVLAGFELHLSEIGDFGLVGAVYVVLRVTGKIVGLWLGRRWAGAVEDMPAGLGMGLLCQAGVAIGLADFLVRTWGVDTPTGFEADPLALRLKTVIVGSVVLFELGGPLALKRTIVRSGEVMAMTLLRRSGVPPAGGTSVTRLAAGALLRMVRPPPSAAASGADAAESDRAESLRVRDIMRSNIKLIPASAGLDEVLHFVERSRYNDFPVADESGRLVGMIHFSELRKILYDPVLRDLVRAMDLADVDLAPVAADSSLKELFDRFQQANTGLLPVVDSLEHRLVVGLVEQRDLLRSLHISG